MPCNIMLDLETFGTRPGCVLRSIGAVVFDLDGVMKDYFYANINPVSCEDVGMFYDPETVAWWEKQSQQARDSLTENQRPLEEVLQEFTQWFALSNGQSIWAQGSSFDPPLIEEAFRRCKMKAPWKYYDTRDTRTVYALAKFDPRSMPRDGLYHNALDDCKYQVACVAAAVKKLQMMG